MKAGHLIAIGVTLCLLYGCIFKTSCYYNPVSRTIQHFPPHDTVYYITFSSSNDSFVRKEGIEINDSLKIGEIISDSILFDRIYISYRDADYHYWLDMVFPLHKKRKVYWGYNTGR